MAVPDYELQPVVVVDRPDQLKAMAEPTRRDIVDLVLERAATVTELARAVGRPKSTVAYHVHVLEAAGLLRVVYTRRVRAIDERFYGRTGRTFVFRSVGATVGGGPLDLVDEAKAEMRPDPEGVLATLRHARVPAERAEEFFGGLARLAEDFTRLPSGGDTLFGLLVAVFPTDRPVLPPSEGTG